MKTREVKMVKINTRAGCVNQKHILSTASLQEKNILILFLKGSDMWGKGSKLFFESSMSLFKNQSPSPFYLLL